jgi:outer membrane protein TolC
VPAIQTQFEVLLRQNLLKGFRKVQAEYDLEINRNNLDISDQEFRRAATEIIVQAQDQFRELEFALKDIEVKQKSMELAETILEQNRARFEVGSASRLEVVEAEAEVESRREELIRAQFTYRRAQDQLVKLITPLKDPREFSGEIVPDSPVAAGAGPEESFDQLMRLASELRPELEQSDLAVANREVELERSRDQLKPALELVAGYQQFGLGGTQVIRDFSRGFIDAPIVAIIPGGLGDSLSQVFSGDFYGYVLGFNLQVPLANTDARARNAQARIELNRAHMQRLAQEQLVGLEIRDTLTQIEMNRARLQAAEAAVRAARERLEGEQARFEVGMGTTRQLIEAQRDLLQAESVVVRARTDLAKNYSQLDRAVGRTFQRFNLVLTDALGRNVK